MRRSTVPRVGRAPPPSVWEIAVWVVLVRATSSPRGRPAPLRGHGATLWLASVRAWSSATLRAASKSLRPGFTAVRLDIVVASVVFQAPRRNAPQATDAHCSAVTRGLVDRPTTPFADHIRPRRGSPRAFGSTVKSHRTNLLPRWREDHRPTDLPGRTTGHQYATVMATDGQTRWPPTGSLPGTSKFSGV